MPLKKQIIKNIALKCLKTKYPVVISAFALTAFISAQTAASDDTPPSFLLTQQLNPTVNTIELKPLDNEKLLERDRLKMQESAAIPRPFVRYAEPRLVSVSPTSTEWENVVISKAENSESMVIWRATIHSPGALSLNLGFRKFHMPKGGALYIYTPDRSQIVRPFTAADNEDHEQLWGPITSGDKATIEVVVPENKLGELKLELSSVNHGYIGDSVKDILEEVSLKSGACNVDVVCPQGDGWRDQIRSAAAYSTGGGMFCSGAAINNTAFDGRGFFLTANHCGINSGNAPSMVVYWNFENSFCRTPGSGASGGDGDGQLNQFSTGAIFRAGYDPSDMTLVELDDPIDPAFNVYLSGWDSTSNVPTSAVGIHHPNVNEKRISFENDPLVTDGSTHLEVTDWDIGTTEPGSSGSPLYNQDQRIVGQLTGGSAACGNDGFDVYGWLNVSWNGGGSSSTRLSNWLDAAGTGQRAIDGMNASGPQPTVTPTPTITPTPTPTPPPGTGVTIYQHCNYDGYSATLAEGMYSTAQQNSMGVLNNDISSLTVPDGFIVQMFSNDGFSGTSVIKDSDDSCLVDDSFNDQLSSIVVTKEPTEVVTMFQHCNYDGYAISLEVGSYTMNDLIALGMNNDDISSLQVTSGYRIDLYQHHDFTGNMITKTSDDTCLVDDGFNDDISSVVISRN